MKNIIYEVRIDPDHYCDENGEACIACVTLTEEVNGYAIWDTSKDWDQPEMWERHRPRAIEKAVDLARQRRQVLKDTWPAQLELYRKRWEERVA
jgi:hypothetical protein